MGAARGGENSYHLPNTLYEVIVTGNTSIKRAT